VLIQEVKLLLLRDCVAPFIAIKQLHFPAKEWLHFSNKKTVLQSIYEHPREHFKAAHWKSII